MASQDEFKNPAVSELFSETTSAAASDTGLPEGTGIPSLSGAEAALATIEPAEPFLPHEPRVAQWAGRVGKHHVLLMLLSALLLWLIVGTSSLHTGTDYRQGEVPTRDIVAPHSALVADRTETTERRRDAAALVPPVYDANPSAQERALAQLNRLLSSGEYSAKYSEAERQQIALAGERAVRAVYRGGQIRSDVGGDLVTAEARIVGALREWAAKSDLSAREYAAAQELARRAARIPNLVVDERATQQARQDAQNSVRTVYQRVTAGDVIVPAGDIITQSRWEMLQELGLVAPRFDLKVAFSQLALCVLLVLLAGGYLTTLDRPLLSRPAALWLAAMTPVVFLFVFRLLLRVPHADLLLIPMAVSAAIMVTLLFEAHLGILLGFVIAALGSFMTGGDVGLFLTAMLVAWIGALSSANIISRGQLIRSGLLAGVASGVLTAVFGLLREDALEQIFSVAIWSSASTVLAVIVAVGLAMLLERPFGITTHLRLMELMAPEEAILRRLQTEAPGTYTHSLMVSLLGEAAAKATEADALLCRVGGLYHDIGKLRRPHCFVENQGGSNIHDQLAPQVSASLILAHVTDGIALGKALKLPLPILDIIATHHGTTRVEYFYQQALSQNEVINQELHEPRLALTSVDEDAFRYAGPRPQSKEAAIILLADAVEASSRALPSPTQEKLEHHVQAMISARLRDGELADCELTLRDLSKIGDAFLHVLKGALHHRIEYPTNSAKANGNGQSNEHCKLNGTATITTNASEIPDQQDLLWMQDALAESFTPNGHKNGTAHHDDDAQVESYENEVPLKERTG